MNAAQGTVVNKARQFAAEGKLSEKNALALEYVYGVRVLNKSPKTTPVETLPEETTKIGEKKTMEELTAFIRSLDDMFPTLKLADRKVEGAEDVTAVRDEISKSLVALTADISDKLALAETIPEELRSVEAITKLTVEAAAGRQYKSDLVELALKEGVRANGNDFDMEHWKRFLTEQTDLEVIKASVASFKKAADGKVDPGRKTKTVDDIPVSTVKIPVVPAEAYKVGR